MITPHSSIISLSDVTLFCPNEQNLNKEEKTMTKIIPSYMYLNWEVFNTAMIH